MLLKRLLTLGLSSITLATPSVAFAAETWVKWLMGIDEYNSYVSWGLNLLMSVFSWFTWLGAVVLNFTIKESILNMSSWINNPAIYMAWGTFRDLANIGVIFILLVIGIATILQVQRYGAKQLLAQVLIVAIFINFSIFMAKAVVDVGNIVALRFYDAIASDNPVESDGGISSKMMAIMNLQQLYKASLNQSAKDQIASSNAVQAAVAPSGSKLTNSQVILISFAGIILFIITGFVFFGMAVALVHRFVTITLLIIFSSAAFAAAILPKTRPLWDMWLRKLIENAFYAPIFMMMIWVSFLVLEQLPTVVNKQAQLSAITIGTTQSSDAGAAAIFNILIVCALMIASLMGAQKLGLAGSATAMKSLTGLRNVAGRYAGRAAGGAIFGSAAYLGQKFVGRQFDRASDKLAHTNFSRSLVGKQVLKMTRKAADASYDGRAVINKGLAAAGIKNIDIGKPIKGYVTRAEEWAKDEKKYVDSLGPNPVILKNLESASEAILLDANKYKKDIFEPAQRELREAESGYERLKNQKTALEAAYGRAKDRNDIAEMRNLDIELQDITRDFVKADALLEKRKADFSPISKKNSDLQDQLGESRKAIADHKESHKQEYIDKQNWYIKNQQKTKQWMFDAPADMIFDTKKREEVISLLRKKKGSYDELLESLKKDMKKGEGAASSAPAAA